MFHKKNLQFKKRLGRKRGKVKVLSILAHKLGRAVYFMVRRNQAFPIERFLAAAHGNHLENGFFRDLLDWNQVSIEAR